MAERLGNRISANTVLRILHEAGLNKTKPTRKPGLSDPMRKARLEWCLAHQSWTLEDWKHVIWSDETSVVLCIRRGGYRVWRTPDQSVNKSAIRERWKGYSEFMFWACFSYDQKGPCHVWRAETPSERRQAEAELEALNAQNEPLIRAKWEADEAVRYAAACEKNSRTARRRKWIWCEKRGKLVRKAGHGGVDWYRYQKQILLDKLLPFAKQVGPQAIVQEDRAPSHAHFAQEAVFNLAGVKRLLWCGNSPDLNMIEPVWPELKRRTTRSGAPKSGPEAERVWRQAWASFEQPRLQAFVERIPWHIQQVIACDGGNEYTEGRNKMLQTEFYALAKMYGAYGSYAPTYLTTKREGGDDFGAEFRRLVRANAVRFG
jgi:hypothetical protein